MKKTISVNIKGINFIIDEDAYELLDNYLKRLEINLKSQQGAKDILEDIELRIAELCQQKLSDKKQVVEIEDVQSVIATLGQPEDFIEEEEKSTSSQKEHFTEGPYSKEKRFYRDVENGKIAGICAGFSNYFNIDVLFVRILFLILLFFAGFGFPLYIILWVIMPKTNSTIDRLKMQGKPITVDSVKEEIEQAAERVKSSSKNFATKIRQDENISKRFSSVARVIRSIIGFGFIGLGLFFLIVFCVLFFGGLRFIPLQGTNGFLSFTELAEVIFNDSFDVILAFIGIGLVVSSVVLFFISNGTYLMMRVRTKWTKISSVALIIFGTIGVFLCIVIGTKTGSDFSNEAEIEKNIGTLNSSELVLEIVPKKHPELGEYRINASEEYQHRQPIIIGKNTIQDNGVKLIYKQSKDSLFHVYQHLNASSYSYKKALFRAKNIKHYVHWKGVNILELSPEFSYLRKDKIRAQRTTLIIEIPSNKWVKVKSASGGEKISFNEQMDGIQVEKTAYINANGSYETWD